MTEAQLLDRIVVNPQVMAGEPVIKGTRITVALVLNLLEKGTTIEEILDDYPHITLEDVQACFGFARKSIEDISFMPLMEQSQMRFLVDECAGRRVAEW